MSGMVERVARSLYEREHEAEKWDENFAKYFAWDGPNFKGQDYFRKLARAAIEAMREPTEEMTDMGHSEIIEGGDIHSAWAAMIDTALGKVDA